MALPKFLQSCFPSYDLTKLDKEKDRGLIITQILNYGTRDEIEWLGKNYSRKEIEKAVKFPSRGMWTESVLTYWQKIFNIKLNKEIINRAVINLNSV